jgi:hypothetical protein
VTPPVNDPVTSIDPAYEAVLRKMVGDLEQAPDAHERWAAANALQGQADSAIGELLDTVTVLRDERDAVVDGRRAVCDCGTSASLEVDEDGLCSSCGADVIVCADLHSAELVSGVRAEKDAAENRGYRQGVATCVFHVEKVVTAVEQREASALHCSQHRSAQLQGAVSMARKIRDSLLTHAGRQTPMTDRETKARRKLQECGAALWKVREMYFGERDNRIAAEAERDALRSEVDQWRALGLDIVDARRLLLECESALKIVRAMEQVERDRRIAAEAEVTRLRADIIEVVADLPHPVEGACSTRPEAEPEAVRLLLATLGGGR